MLRSASCLKFLLSTVMLTANLSFADNLVFDRGLPTANLNNAAGANRSNVAWADATPFVVGDSFGFGTTGQNYTISKLRIWLVEGNAGLQALPADRTLTLYGGMGTTTPAIISNSNWAATPVTYASGDPYEGSSGAMWQLWRVDFANLNWNVQGGTSYNFYVGGNGRADLGGPFLSASNLALSGSTQEGADGLAYSYNPNTKLVETWTSNVPGVWDKSSDINVQVFTTPEPGSYVELAAGFIGVCLFVVRRRRSGAR